MVSHAGQNPVGYEPGLDAGGMRGTADGACGNAVRKGSGIVTGFGREIPARGAAAEQAAEHGKDQHRQMRARRPAAGPEGGVQAGAADGG